MTQNIMRVFSLTRAKRYAIAILGAVIVAVLRLALDPFLGEELPTTMFVFTVIVAAWYGGLWPGLLATALSLLLGEYLFIAPRGRIFQYENPLSQEQVITLGFVGTAFSLLFDRIRKGVKAEFEYLENFHLLVEGVRDYAIFRLDPEGRVSSWNFGAARITGYREKEIIGRDISVFFTPEEIEAGAHQRVLEIAAAGGQFEGEGWRLRKDGSRFWANVSGTALHDAKEGLRGFAVVARDITERKQAELALRESEERLQCITDATQDALWEIDLKTRRLWWSEGAKPLFGHSPSELEIGLEDWYNSIHPEDVDRVRARFETFLQNDEPDRNDEYRFRRADGSYAYIQDRSRKYYDESGTPTRIAGAMVDITERKRIEGERERLLRQETAAREEAETASRMKDEFLATISHELRTPLTSILGWARMLTGGALSDAQARHAVEVIAKSAQSQTRLVDDLLDTSRIITGRLELNAQPVEIERVFQATVDVIRPSAEVKGVALSAVIDAPGGVVFGDGNRLQQTIWNLLSNAVKFTNEGGRIEARLGRAGNQIEITVSDTGIGIEPQFLPHVFERFRQADSASTRKYGGLGLGLAIVRHIVEMHGGGVSALSPGRGRGATFKIILPLASTSLRPPLEGERLEPEAPQKKRRKAPEECQKLDGVRVLLVEDDPETLDMLKFVFDECGAEVITAASASEALEALERFRPDALVSDIAMPDQDGYDLIRQVRSRGPERGEKIPAVAVTAYAASEDRVRALAAGFQMHVAKPIDPEELIAMVASLTGHIHF